MLKVKVCGLKDSDNIKEVSELNPNYVGFIFYAGSKRNAEGLKLPEINNSIKKIGVFVNQRHNYINAKIAEYNLDYVQLHGVETPEFCKTLKPSGVKIIKAFNLHESFEFEILEHYKPHVDMFLFDSKGKSEGGNGIKFDWSLLNRYDNELPFLLSGGIDINDIQHIAKLSHLNIAGIDVNSKFEFSPGLKDVSKLILLQKEVSKVSDKFSVI